MKKLKRFLTAVSLVLVFSILFTSHPMQVLAAETGQNRPIQIIIQGLPLAALRTHGHSIVAGGYLAGQFINEHYQAVKISRIGIE